MGKPKKSLDDIIKYIADNNLENEYKLLSTEYINYSTKLLFLHKKCGKTFYMDYNHFVNRGQRCNNCNIGKYTQEQFKEKIKNLFNDEIVLLEDYNPKEKILVKHKKCNKTYKINAYTLLQGYPCHYCSSSRLKTFKKFESEVYNMVGNEYKILSKEYINNKTKVTFFHSKCGKKFDMRPNDFLSNKNRCPYCEKYITNNSKGAITIENYLKNENYYYEKEFTFDDCKYKNKLRFDFMLFDEDDNPIIAIEYNGKQHYENSFNCKTNFNKQLKRDEIKRKYCKDNNIILIEISYKEKDIIKILNESLTTIETIGS